MNGRTKVRKLESSQAKVPQLLSCHCTLCNGQDYNLKRGTMLKVLEACLLEACALKSAHVDGTLKKGLEGHITS